MIEQDKFKTVNPKIIYPSCMKRGDPQDCFNCDLYKSNLCNSPRGACVKKYHNHPKGCPNYGKKNVCPPSVPMFDQVFDISKPIYAIYSVFDLEAHVEKMRTKHPQWTEIQLRNVLYWQGTARKKLRHEIADFNSIYKSSGYYVVLSPDAMGVNVTDTLREVGVFLEWPARKNVYKVAMAGIPLSDRYLHLLL